MVECVEGIAGLQAARFTRVCTVEFGRCRIWSLWLRSADKSSIGGNNLINATNKVGVEVVPSQLYYFFFPTV